MPISDCEVRDPRMRRTRQLLQAALRQLMKLSSFDDISVQDIAEAATINRATFYDHYTDKFALLEAMVGGGFHQLLHERAVTFHGDCPSAAAAVIHAACDYLIQEEGDKERCSRQSAFFPLMDAAMIAAIRRVLAAGMAQHGSSEFPNSDLPNSELPGREWLDMRSAAASWAIYGAVKQWFLAPARRPVETVVPEILRLVTPLLAGRS